MHKAKRVFLVHGWDGYPDNHWFPWLKKELESRGFKVESLAMPNAAHPKVFEWLSKITESVGNPTKDDYFVGHSLGCISIVRYIVQLPPEAKVGGCVFVAGFSGNINIPEIAEFYLLPLDFKNTKKHCENFVTIFSDNDPVVPLDNKNLFEDKLSARTIVEHNKGHFCKSDGVIELPSVLEAVLEISGNA